MPTPALPASLPFPRVQIVMKLTMPGTMSRILGGFRKALAQTNRLPVCNLSDQPQVGRGGGGVVGGWWGGGGRVGASPGPDAHCMQTRAPLWRC